MEVEHPEVLVVLHSEDIRTAGEGISLSVFLLWLLLILLKNGVEMCERADGEAPALRTKRGKEPEVLKETDASQRTKHGKKPSE